MMGRLPGISITASYAGTGEVLAWSHRTRALLGDEFPSTADIRNILCRGFQGAKKTENTVSVKAQVIQLLPTPSRLDLAKAELG